MKDIVFDGSGKLQGEAEASEIHQEDILVMHKGWNKFFPHLGVGVMDYVQDEEDAESLKSAISFEFEKDGMQLNEIVFDPEGKIYVDAKY